MPVNACVQIVSNQYIQVCCNLDIILKDDDGWMIGVLRPFSTVGGYIRVGLCLG